MVTRFKGITWTLFFIADNVKCPFLHAPQKSSKIWCRRESSQKTSVRSFMQRLSRQLVYAKELRGLCPDLVVCPAGLPHAQSLGVGELSFEAQQDPAVAEEQLEAVLPQPGQVLVEAGQHETQQLPQVHLEAGQRGYTMSYKHFVVCLFFSLRL